METPLLFGKVPIRPTPPEYRYVHASLCLLDAVFSINAPYQSVRTDAGGGIIWRYCRYYGIEPFLRGQTGEDTLSRLRGRFAEHGPERFASEVLDNLSKVNAGGGLSTLKSNVASQLADWLLRNGIDRLGDLRGWARRIDPERVALALKSEGIGGVVATTIKYLAMLAGNDDQIKPDRHIRNFVACIVGHRVSSEEATRILEEEARRTGRTPQDTGGGSPAHRTDP